jgi:hypothetical protein
MPSWLAVPLALSAAAAFALAIPLEHRAAGAAPDTTGFGGRQLATFVAATLRNRWWLLGIALNTAGFALHATALHLGPLAIVQPLLITNVVFAIPVNHRLRRERVPAPAVAWAVVLVVALAGFLLVASAGVPATSEAADRGPAAATPVLLVALVGGLGLLARRTHRTRAATLLGAATGLLFAVTASLVKVCTGLLAQGPLRLLGSWELYALVAVGAAGLVCNQLAYQAGPLTASLPVITVVDPLAAVVIGVVVFDESLRHTTPAVLGEVACLLLLVVAVMRLTRVERPGASAGALPEGAVTEGRT